MTCRAPRNKVETFGTEIGALNSPSKSLHNPPIHPPIVERVAPSRHTAMVVLAPLWEALKRWRSTSARDATKPATTDARRDVYDRQSSGGVAVARGAMTADSGASSSRSSEELVECTYGLHTFSVRRRGKQKKE